MIDRAQISKLLDIYDPFLMIDGVSEAVAGQYCRAFKFIDDENEIIRAHLPSLSLMPASLMIEAMLQTSVLILYLQDNFSGNKAVVTSINAKVLSNITDDKKMIIESHLEYSRRGIVQFKSKAVSSGKVICLGEFSYVCPHLMPKLPKK